MVEKCEESSDDEHDIEQKIKTHSNYLTMVEKTVEYIEQQEEATHDDTSAVV